MGEEHYPEKKVERPRIEEITRIVLAVLADWERLQRRPQSRMAQRLDWLSAHWVLVAFCLSLLAVILAWIFFKVSPLQPLEEIAHKQAEYRRNDAQRDFKRKMVQRHLALGKAFLNVGQYKGAELEYTQALKLDEANTEAQMGLFKAKMYESLDQQQYDPEVVEKRIRFILEENPNDPHAYVFLGDLYSRLDEPKALEYYKQARAIDPAVATAVFGLGVLYHKQGTLDEALRMYEQAVKRSPWNQKYLNNLAYLYYETKQYPKAVETYEKILQLDDKFLLSYHELANVYRLMGHLDDTIRYQEDLIALLDDQVIPTLEKNKIPWYFTADGGRVYLYDLPEKQCLAYYGLSVTLSLLERQTEAESFVNKARRLQTAAETSIRALVEADLRRLQTEQPQFADRIKQYREKFY